LKLEKAKHIFIEQMKCDVPTKDRRGFGAGAWSESKCYGFVEWWWWG